ncbi:hypothetical protein [Clostridium brassicae]|uniref:Spo0E family sporulation regulatory protein-aspartic acid phosphatase n=1 Tax=Clostridium brassicae TaxID=2999072 RepID=A0ABT4D6D9_9CLOT|nr:hypothetical protein [Clostridium brassicae]MCY6957864.1 hypothetical protein [Clostridium brassicae]
MKSQEQVEKQLVELLREQADRLEKGDIKDIFVYKAIRQQIPVLEDILELNVLNK